MYKLIMQAFPDVEQKAIKAIRKAVWWRIILLWALTESFRILLAKL